MELFIEVSFWCASAGIAFKLLALAIGMYPMDVKQTAASAVIHVAFGFAWCLWAAKLLGWI